MTMRMTSEEDKRRFRRNKNKNNVGKNEDMKGKSEGAENQNQSQQLQLRHLNLSLVHQPKHQQQQEQQKRRMDEKNANESLRLDLLSLLSFSSVLSILKSKWPSNNKLSGGNGNGMKRLRSMSNPGSNVFVLLAILLQLSGVFVIQLPVVSAQHRPNQPPVFSAGGDLARFSIPEDTPVGSVVYRLKGTDPENGELTYSVSGEYLRVNRKTGDLTLIKALDRETEPSIDVIISLTDDGHGSEPATVSLRRELVISDINDNAPKFHKRPYSFKVSERTKVGATVFSDLLITDDDWAEHAEVTLTCAADETPLACQIFSVSSEQVDEGKYIGIITLASPLDFETTSSYTMTLRATDGDNVATALVAITVLDIQDQKPRFFGGPYVFSIRENSPPGTPVGNISVQDGDTGSPRDLQLKVIDEAGNNYFRLSSIHKDVFTGTFSAVLETGEARLDAEEEFIRENLGVYELILEAREYPLNADDIEPTLVTRTAVAIVIKDDDDLLPTFTPSKFSQVLKVPYYNPGESYIFPEFHVQVEDGDVDPDHSIFSLRFDWNPNSNIVPAVSPEIPIESIFGFITPANDHPTVQRKGIITMEILNMSLLVPGSSFDIVIGAVQNDHIVSKINVPIEIGSKPKILPKFNSTVFRIKVSEDISEGDTVTQISAQNHKDVPGLKYSLIGVGADRFDVEENTGVIKCGRKCVDFEREKSHFFLVKGKAGDSASVEDVVFSLLYIDVLDTLDNPPEFETIPEKGTALGENGVIRRSVPDGTTKFQPPFVIKASDLDVGDQLSYNVTDHTMNNSGIYIEPETGELKLSRPLRWEESGEHRLTVTATDLVGKKSEQTVLLVVQAVPNLPPSFPYGVHKLEIPETLEKGSPIFRAVAHDPDGQDAAIKYSISAQPEADLFIIEENTGMIRLNGKLDFEMKDRRSYPVIVRAQDEGKPSEAAAATILISVIDVNDEEPKFSKRHYVVDMSESEQPEYTLLTLKAKDRDAGSELEFDISCPCRVWDGSGSEGSNEDAENYFNSFRVDPFTGEIVLVSSLVHKKSSVIEFKGTVRDLHGVKPQNDTATITVYVLVQERTKPIFGPPWTPGNPWINLTVPENIELDSAIVTFNAFDYIAGEHINNFTLVDSDSENFVLEGNELKTVAELDYEIKNEYILAVKARDVRGGESVANVAVKLSDFNDNSPVLSKSEYKGQVAENSEYPTPILTVEASDRDDPENYGAVRYALAGPTSHLFQIDELAGVIQVAPGADIDREKMPHHTLTVLAIDTPAGGPFQRTASATVQISILDENDNSPECRTSEILVPENSLVGTPFANVTCTDLDLKTKLTFNLKDDLNLNLFTIDPATGVLSTAKSLRGRGRSAPYIVNVMVEDGKERTTSISVPITVANVIPNDGKPHFVNENLTAVISEGSHRSTPVLLIKAVDTDSYDNGEGRLLYKIMKQIYPCLSRQEMERQGQGQGQSSGHGNSSSPSMVNMTKIQDVNFFRLDEQSGMLSLREKIDREQFDCFSILVSVEDLGTPPQMESQWYEVHISDIDDNLPRLEPKVRNLELSVNETTPKGTAIYNFTGIDEDISPNNRIAFEIAGGGSDLFKIENAGGPRNASLILNGDLTVMDHSELTLVIKCHPKDKRISVPDCISKIRIRIKRDQDNQLLNSNYMMNGNSGGRSAAGSGLFSYSEGRKMPEMILGVAAKTPVGNLIGNANMPPKMEIGSSMPMYHPNQISTAPYNVSGILKVEPRTGDIIVWDNLDNYQNGHFRMEMNDLNGSTGTRKNLKVFVAPNEQLLSADTAGFGKLQRWMEETDSALNVPSPHPKVSKGSYKVLTFAQSNAPDGKTKVCFQLLENENMMSPEKALKLLEKDELQVLFLKYSFDAIHKGCPQPTRTPARLTLGATTGRFWVERSLLGIASVVAIASISAILILCLVNRSRVKS